MAINFDALPKERPEGSSFALPAEGFHKAKIEQTAVKVSKTGNEYLELKLKLSGGEVVYDRIMSSDAPAIQYKTARFIQACKLPLVGELTFEDLGKVVLGKELVVDIVNKENEYQGKTTTKAEVEIFKNDIYYGIEMYDALVNEPTTPGTNGTGTF